MFNKKHGQGDSGRTDQSTVVKATFFFLKINVHNVMSF